MNWVTRRIWETMVDPSSIRFFQHLLDDATGPEIAETLQEYFAEEVEKIHFDDDTPGIITTIFTDAWGLTDWELLADRWEHLGEQ
jgi:hypothetical protein